MEQSLFKQMIIIRKRTVSLLEKTPESILLEIPKGFNNNLLWHFGHIFWAQEVLMHSFLKEEHNCSSEFQEMFSIGSSPNKWTTEPPSISEIKTMLEKQPNRIVQTFSGRLEEAGEKPFSLGPDVTLNTVAEVLNFVLWHEGLHQGEINAMLKLLGENK
ncbi:DinB family protein [Bacillus alkalisoli]|uniref:DinB family protein n=1 Tax=Bacillus alkalisoli TaxID=2011008 RepID=UPI000C238592|nr:DinB family protein [Bacillus alkalisoli]